MNKRELSVKPRSLAQHFEAPKDFRGCFGWMCGYSADADFLDDAAERFTRQSRAQRAYGGHIALALMLDPGNSNISLVDAPSVMHLPINNPDKKPFLLLHAKVAILWFRHESDAQRWQLRLIVSTGNWTRETLEDSLDLAWRIDLSNEDLKNPDAATHQACADMKAGWDMLKWLRDFFDTRILDAVPPGRGDNEPDNAMRSFESKIRAIIRNVGKTNARFFDNRKESFLSQLPELINATGVTAKRNYLAMGSGFYEAPSSKDVIPSVLRNIVDALKGQQLLTEKPEVDVFVNPKACQAVATSLPALTKASFTVRSAGQPDYFGQNVQRALHAKFVFSANYRNNSNLCNSAWLYLGSGNLTGPGFGNKMSKKGGNLEAGVVFAPTEDLYWKKEEGLNLEQVISNVLPVQWETDVGSLMNPLSAGSEMPDRDLQFIAAPIAWLFWREEADSSWLKAPEGTTYPFETLNEDGEACTPDAEGRYLWSGSRPRQILLRWMIDGETFQSAVPVLDEFGRLAAKPLTQIDLDEAWWQLANFPMPPDDDDLPPADDQNTESVSSPQPAKTTSVATYPIRQMMQLIENIAAKQTAVPQIDWPAWCIRLEQCLVQTSGNSVLKEFTTLEINPLSPLWESSFRPTFAETNDTPEGARYEFVLRRVEAEWDVASLRKIGCHDETKI